MAAGIEKLNPEINAVVEVYAERIEEANKRLIPDKLFSGVPFLLKDAGATEAGTIQD
jgi:Asp-tRNA(Asn)/Glu-tRNA(Gln) amidotransferase A subunit family amidase